MRDKSKLPIAIFDSGVGGLTVFKAINSLLPNESLLYLGDTARVPYGTKSRDTIMRYALMAAAKLAEHGAKMLVIACNTATAAALDAAREKFAPMPVLGVVEPGARAAVAASESGHIAVIATEATIRGQAYQKAIGALAPAARVTGRACTLFVSLAEEGWLDGPVAEGVASRYLADIFPPGRDSAWPDTLLLGCTHFPLFQKTLAKLLGPGVTIVDSAMATAASVKAELAALGLLGPEHGQAFRQFLTTDNKERFIRAGGLFLGRAIGETEVDLVDL